jgi:hypothetical protein
MTNKGGGAVRGGAGGGDAYTNLIMTERKAAASMRDCRTTGPILSVPPKLPPPTAEVVIDGIYVPDTALKTNADVAYVLNQEPGKLRIKDVKVGGGACAGGGEGAGIGGEGSRNLKCLTKE